MNTPHEKVLPLIYAGALMFAGGCSRHGEHQPAASSPGPVAQVRVAPAENRPQLITEEVVGTIRAQTRATLEAKVSGRIQDMPVCLGQVVKKGELVARLDAAEVKARCDQAQASLEQAERDWNRISSLYKEQAVTRSEYDRAYAQQQLAKAAVAEAEAMMRYTEVQAPFDAVVSRKWAEMGDLASPGKPLVDLEDPSSLQLDADLPESLGDKVQLGTALLVRVEGLSRELEAKIAEMAPSADPVSRTIRVKLTLPQTAGLMPGRFARLLVPLGESRSVDVPASALVQRGQLEMVFVISNQQAQMHLVKSGRQRGNEVTILSGLDPGDQVAVDGAHLLSDGQRVEVK